MKQIPYLVFYALICLFFSSCSENYSNGERIGLVTQFSKSGLIYKTWEGHLNLTQTGMNSSVPFDFSVDRDAEDANVIATLDSAATYGWKVKLVYHEIFGWNWFNNRGETDHFITKVDVLDKNPVGNIFNQESNPKSEKVSLITGKIIDTIYLVINKNCNCKNCVR